MVSFIRSNIYVREFIKGVTIPPQTSTNVKIRQQVINCLETSALVTKRNDPVKLAIFIDIDCPDHNSAIGNGQLAALEDGIPFVTTRGILSGSDVIENFSTEIREKLISCIDKFDFYAHGEILVVIPKSQTLQSLDFNPNLGKITVSEILEGSKERSNYQSLIEVFSLKPKRPKVILIEGHGSLTSVAALKSSNFVNFLNFLQDQKCAALTITSCYSGGTSTDLYQNITFPVIVRSIGDFPSRSKQEGEKNLRVYLDSIAAFLEESAHTHQGFRKMIRGVEGKKHKVPQNYVKVYFPNSTGFRPICEGGKSFSLTYSELKKSQIENPKGISLRRIDILKIHPLIIDTPLICGYIGPVLLSMIASNSHHFIRKIVLKSDSVDDFIHRTSKFHRNSRLAVNKAFFISNISTWKDVVLFLNPSNNFCFYREDEICYCWNLESDEKPIKITHFQFASHKALVEIWTRASETRVKAATGGHENEEMFFQKIFSNESRPIPKEKESLSESSPDITNLFGTPLIYEVIKAGDQESLNVLLQKGVNVNCQCKIEKSNSPLHLALKIGNVELIESLLKVPNIDLNIRNDEGNSPLAYAGNFFEKLIKLGADPNLENAKGMTLLARAVYLNDVEKVDQLLAVGADPNKGKFSAVYMAVLRGNIPMIQKLLDAGGSAFVGESPFVRAVRSSSPEVVAFLMEQPDCKFDNNIMEIAIESGSSKKIKMLLERGVPQKKFDEQSVIRFCKLDQWKGLIDPNRMLSVVGLEAALDMGADPMFEEGFSTSPFDKALNTKNVRLLTAFLQKMSSFPFSSIAEIIKMGDVSLVKILENKGVELNEPIFINCAIQSNKMEMVKFFHDREARFDEYLSNIEDMEILKFLVERGADINRVFTNVCAKGDLSLVNWALENGAIVNEAALEAANGHESIVRKLLLLGASWTEKAAAKVVGKGNIPFIKYCMRCGANIATEEAYLAAILSGKLEVLAFVQREGGDISLEKLNKQKVILRLIRAGHEEMLLEVLEMGLEIKEDKNSIWLIVVKNRYMKAFKALLKIETDQSIPFRHVIEFGNLEMYLELKYQAVSNEMLKKLLERECIDILRHLFAQGLDIDKTIGGCNFFQISVAYNFKKVLKLMLEMGADPNQEVEKELIKRPALFWVVQAGDLKLINMLLNAGAVLTKDVIAEAYENDNPKIFDLIESA